MKGKISVSSTPCLLIIYFLKMSISWVRVLTLCLKKIPFVPVMRNHLCHGKRIVVINNNTQHLGSNFHLQTTLLALSKSTMLSFSQENPRDVKICSWLVIPYTRIQIEEAGISHKECAARPFDTVNG